MAIAIIIIKILVCDKRGGRLRRRDRECLSPPVPLSPLAHAHYDSGTDGYAKGTLAGAVDRCRPDGAKGLVGCVYTGVSLGSSLHPCLFAYRS